MTTPTISCWKTFFRMKCKQVKLFSCKAVKLENGFLCCDPIGSTVGYWWKIIQSLREKPVNTIFKHLVINFFRLSLSTSKQFYQDFWREVFLAAYAAHTWNFFWFGEKILVPIYSWARPLILKCSFNLFTLSQLYIYIYIHRGILYICKSTSS